MIVDKFRFVTLNPLIIKLLGTRNICLVCLDILDDPWSLTPPLGMVNPMSRRPCSHLGIVCSWNLEVITGVRSNSGTFVSLEDLVADA